MNSSLPSKWKTPGIIWMLCFSESKGYFCLYRSFLATITVQAMPSVPMVKWSGRNKQHEQSCMDNCAVLVLNVLWWPKFVSVDIYEHRGHHVHLSFCHVRSLESTSLPLLLTGCSHPQECLQCCSGCTFCLLLCLCTSLEPHFNPALAGF